MVDFSDWEDQEEISADGSGSINYYNDDLLLKLTQISFEYKNSDIKIHYELDFMDGKYLVVLDYEDKNQAFKDLVENEPKAVVFSGPIKTSDGLTVGTFQVLANERVVILDQKGKVIHKSVSLEDKNGLSGNWRLVRMTQFSGSGEFIGNNTINLICPSFLTITADQVIKFDTEMELIECTTTSDNDVVICDTSGNCYMEPDVYFAEAVGPSQLALDNILYRWSFHEDTLVLEGPLEEDGFSRYEPSKFSYHEYYLQVTGPVPPSDSPCDFCPE
jgi:hypothetical protein